jgi:hypothetical protein
LRQRGRASQRLLPIGGHDRTPRAAADGRIAETPLVLGHDSGPPLIVSPRTPRAGLDQHLDRSGRCHGQQSEPQQPAQLAHPWIAFPAAPATGGANRQPDLVAYRRAVHGLQHQFEVEADLQLADDDRHRSALMQRHQVAAAYLALHLEAEIFEETLDRQI